MSIWAWLLVPISDKLVWERVVIWVMLARVMSLSTSASATTDDPATRSEAVRVLDTSASVIVLAGSDTVPAITVRPFDDRMTPTTSRAVPGVLVPIPTPPELR